MKKFRKAIQQLCDLILGIAITSLGLCFVIILISILINFNHEAEVKHFIDWFFDGFGSLYLMIFISISLLYFGCFVLVSVGREMTQSRMKRGNKND